MFTIIVVVVVVVFMVVAALLLRNSNRRKKEDTILRILAQGTTEKWMTIKDIHKAAKGALGDRRQIRILVNSIPSRAQQFGNANALIEHKHERAKGTREWVIFLRITDRGPRSAEDFLLNRSSKSLFPLAMGRRVSGIDSGYAVRKLECSAHNGKAKAERKVRDESHVESRKKLLRRVREVDEASP